MYSTCILSVLNTFSFQDDKYRYLQYIINEFYVFAGELSFDEAITRYGRSDR